MNDAIQPRSRSATITEFVGEGEFPLRLGIGELEALQEKIGCGPNMIAERLSTGAWFIGDIKQTIRLGLIGGGMSQKEAHELTERTVKEGYINDYVLTAYHTVIASLIGVDDEDFGDVASGEAEAGMTPPAYSNSGNVTNSAEPLDSPQTK